MPTFNDSENIAMFQPAGDYRICVVDFEIGISSSAKTAGSEKYEVKFEVEDSAGKAIGRFYETLIDHPSCAWKLDTFLKCCGVKLNKGESFSFRKDEAQKNGVKWVNPLGLRGWAALFVDEYQGPHLWRTSACCRRKQTRKPRFSKMAISSSSVTRRK